MIVIGIAGGTGSGKSTVVRRIIENLSDAQVSVLAQDSYYKDNGDMKLEDRQKINFDHPDAIEWDLLIDHIEQLRRGEEVGQPIYSYLSCTRSDETIPVQPHNVVIVEGILCLGVEKLRDVMDIKVFVDCESDVRLSRVILRDIVERGRSVEQVLVRYEDTVRPSHIQFIEPTKRYADIIVPSGGQNHVAIDILTQFIQKNLY
ncbi:uridine kinase [Halosquirtibacter laminarini]|uniref:Uridine kinase n=1 Tax=Halosquirtibacter laminarini TaxID=3374600 RepID=A0AC61NN87_9BACT|nr:uridine kinase [Prolixibacteraceae bacterium]